MGRGKIEIKRIENTTSRQVTFSKRRSGLLKKAKELSVLCDAQVGVIVFSSTGKMFDFCNPPNMQYLISRYLKQTSPKLENFSNTYEMARMKEEHDRLEALLRPYSSQDLSSLNLNDLNQLEQDVQISLEKVRQRKRDIIDQEFFIGLGHKDRLLEQETNYPYPMIQDGQQLMNMGMDEKLGGGSSGMMTLFGDVYQDNNATNHDLHEFKLLPMQPNLQQAANFQGLGYGLQLWYDNCSENNVRGRVQLFEGGDLFEVVVNN